MPNRPGNDDRITPGSQRDASNSSENGNTSQGSVRTRSNRGFASMDRDKQREIASKGGKAAHAKGTAHEFDSSEAREAGRKGGVAVSRNREHMAAIGRRGGEARGHSRGRAGIAAQTNTGSAESSAGAFQNSRTNADRQVAINNQNEGVAASPQGTRGGTSSLGGERRPSSGLENNSNTARNETFGNH